MNTIFMTVITDLPTACHLLSSPVHDCIFTLYFVVQLSSLCHNATGFPPPEWYLAFSTDVLMLPAPHRLIFSFLISESVKASCFMNTLWFLWNNFAWFAVDVFSTAMRLGQSLRHAPLTVTWAGSHCVCWSNVQSVVTCRTASGRGCYCAPTRK